MCTAVGSVLCTALYLAMAMLAGGLVLALLRLLLGPSTPDRVVALDLMSSLAMGIIAVYATAIGEPSLLTASLVLGLVAFLGTVCLARYLERRVSE
jgi:multicomponent Na+:H+ antiporter subunit F